MMHLLADLTVLLVLWFVGFGLVMQALTREHHHITYLTRKGRMYITLGMMLFVLSGVYLPVIFAAL